MFDTSLQQILAELERLDLLLRVQVWRARQGRGEAGELAAFYIPDAEVDELLDKAIGEPVWASVPLPTELATAAQARLDQLALDIAEHVEESLSRDVPLRLVALAGLFDLTAVDLDVVLLCLGPELDRGSVGDGVIDGGEEVAENAAQVAGPAAEAGWDAGADGLICRGDILIAPGCPDVIHSRSAPLARNLQAIVPAKDSVKRMRLALAAVEKSARETGLNVPA